jgi:hypothetical protein
MAAIQEPLTRRVLVLNENVHMCIHVYLSISAYTHALTGAHTYTLFITVSLARFTTAS